MKLKGWVRIIITTVVILFSVFLGGQLGKVSNLVNDRKITVTRASDVAGKRKRLIRFIWGETGFPADRYPAEVLWNVESPIPNLDNLEGTNQLKIEMEGGVEGVAWHFIPVEKNNRLVVAHQGHICALNDGLDSGNSNVGLARTIDRLLSEGFAVLGLCMPHQRPDDCWHANHDRMFDNFQESGSPIKYFLEPVVVSLNFLRSEYQYEEISMIGISGGGWTATLYAALDPEIRFSFPVAGSLPLYLRYPGYNHDKEQYLPAFYKLSGYPDLYLLGSYGPGRQQVQILIRHDNCCFGENQHNTELVGMPWETSVRGYEFNVQAALRRLGSGSFFLYIDETTTRHEISENTIVNVVLPVIKGRHVPALISTNELDK
jgi:hypothetical protein